MKPALLSPTRLKIATNTMSQLAGKIISSGATIAISFLVAQKLGAAGYGDFAKITTYVAFFFLLADFGLNAIYLQRKEKELFSTLILTRVSWSILLIFIAVALLAFLPQGTTQGFTPMVRFGIILFAPAILFQALITTANAVFQKHLRYDLATTALFMGTSVSLGLILFVFPPTQALPAFSDSRSLPLIAAICALLAGTIVTALFALGFTKRFTKTEASSLRLSPALSLFTASLPFGLTLLFNVIYTRADTMLLTFFRPTADVGVYALAYKVFELFLVIPTFFMNAVYPLLLTSDTKIASADNQGEALVNNAATAGNQEFKKVVQTSAIFLVLISVFITAVVWMGAPWLTLINPEFTASIPVLRILSLSLPAFFLTSVTMWSLVAKRRQGGLLIIYSASMLVSVAANVWFIPQYGYLASAWITVASEGLVLVLSSIVLYKSLITIR